MDSRKVGMLVHYDEATGKYVEGIETNGLINQALIQMNMNIVKKYILTL